MTPEQKIQVEGLWVNGMGYRKIASISEISGGDGFANLGCKAIYHNGSHPASRDDLDGYSSVSVEVHPGLLVPYEENLTTGYVDRRGNWILGGTNCFTDVYLLETGVTYIIALGSTVGTRFRAMFCTHVCTVIWIPANTE